MLIHLTYNTKLLDNGENNRLGVSQCGDPSLQVESSKDQSKTGGGFCKDQGETGTDE